MSTGTKLAVSVFGAALLTAGCTMTPQSKNNPVRFYDIGVSQNTEVLEIAVLPHTTQLTLVDKQRIENFVAVYKDRGHGPLVMSMPSGGVNGQGAVQSAAEARQIAYDMGVNYDQMTGTAYAASGAVGAPLTLAFKTYDVIPPDCPSLTQVDLADTSTNSRQTRFGCAVNSNIAMMIADPADLLGERPMDERDNARRADVLNKYRTGQPTGTERSDDDSGTLSDAVE